MAKCSQCRGARLTFQYYCEVLAPTPVFRQEDVGGGTGQVFKEKQHE